MPYTKYELPTNEDLDLERRKFTENDITFHGLRHIHAHEQYKRFLKEGYYDYTARKKYLNFLVIIVMMSHESIWQVMTIQRQHLHIMNFAKM